MNFDEKDIEFFDNFYKGCYEEIKQQFKLLHDEYNNLKKHPVINRKKINSKEQEIDDMVNPNRMYERLGVDVLSLLVSENIIPIVDPDMKGNLLPEIKILRQKLTDKYGYIIPNTRTMDSYVLEDYEYAICVRNTKVYSGKLSEEDLKQNNPQKIIESLYQVCFDYAHYIMTKTDALKLMELVSSQGPMLVGDIIPTYISPFDLKHICANLIQRKVGIKDIILVFEILNENVKYTQNVNELTDIIEKELYLPIK